MTDKHASVVRKLDRIARIDALEIEAGMPWWRRLVTNTPRRFSLTQDQRRFADIETVFERDDSFGWGVSCLRTAVFFDDGTWTIRTHSPSGPPPATRRSWFRSQAVWLKGERIVEVTDGGEQIAHLTHPADGQPLTVITEEGTSLTLARQTRHLLEAGPLTIQETQRRYVLTPTSPLPLEAALLYWHLMLGDYVRPLPIA